MIKEECSIRPVRSVLLAILCLGSFLVAASALRQSLPGPSEWSVTVKLEHLAEHGGKYDTLFIGSSETFRHVIPEIIDARMAERGFPTKSFNLGGPAMTGFEADHVLREALPLLRPNLRNVLIEPGIWRHKMQGKNRRSVRSKNWHTVRQTFGTLEMAYALDEPLLRRIHFALGHLQILAWRLSNYGDGERLFDGFLGTPPTQSTSAEYVAEGRGYQPLEEDSNEVVMARRRTLLEDSKQYEKAIGLLERANRTSTPTRLINERALADQVALIRATGIEPVFFVPPGSFGTPYAFDLHEEGLIPHLLSFNHPDRYPELYRLDRRYDANHLNREGAEQFSRLLADRWADLIESGALR